MSDEVETTEETEEQDSPVITTLRENERKASERATTAERELAFFKAGLTAEALETAQGKFFAENYKGEATADAVREMATELGLLGEAPTEEPAEEPEEKLSTPKPTDEQLARQRVQQELSEGAPPDDAPTEPTPTAAEAVFRERIRSGVPENVAWSEALGTVFGGAVNGDPSTLYDPDAWREQYEGMY